MLCVRLFEMIWSQNILVPLVSERNETKRNGALPHGLMYVMQSEAHVLF